MCSPGGLVVSWVSWLFDWASVSLAAEWSKASRWSPELILVCYDERWVSFGSRDREQGHRIRSGVTGSSGKPDQEWCHRIRWRETGSRVLPETIMVRVSIFRIVWAMPPSLTEHYTGTRTLSNTQTLTYLIMYNIYLMVIITEIHRCRLAKEKQEIWITICDLVMHFLMQPIYLNKMFVENSQLLLIIGKQILSQCFNPLARKRV